MTPIETLQELARLQKGIDEAQEQQNSLNWNDGDNISNLEIHTELKEVIENNQIQIQELLQPYYETSNIKSA